MLPSPSDEAVDVRASGAKVLRSAVNLKRTISELDYGESMVLTEMCCTKKRNQPRASKITNRRVIERHLPAHASELAVLNDNCVITIPLVLAQWTIEDTVADL